MNHRRLKSLLLLCSFVFSAVVLIGWSQPWFVLNLTFPTENPDGLEVAGQLAAPGLSAFGLAGFAVTAALALSSIVIRRILGVLLILIGIAVVWVSVSAWTDPVFASASVLTSLSAISDLETLRSFVISSSATAWPGISAVSGTLLIPVGIVIIFTANKWGTGSRKFDRVASPEESVPNKGSLQQPVSGKVDKSATNIDSWDSLSNGTDPTIN